MAKYIFSNCFGVFVFDENFKLIEKADVSERDVADIVDGKWIETEKKLIDKVKEADKKDKSVNEGTSSDTELLFVGFKNEKLEGVKIIWDEKKLLTILECFKSNEFFKKFYEINLANTKKSVRGSVKDDLLLIQAINNIEELERTANLLSKRLREWYELYNPEFSKSVPEHRAFVRNVIANSKEELLKRINLSKEKSMGADLDNKDFAVIKSLAKEIEAVYSLRDEEVKYVEELAKSYCPNLMEAAGALIAAKLIALAGSFKKLAELPSSTIQLLGAEKALFRHMKTGAKPPKYGVIMQHPDVMNASKTEKGKAARHLAQKLAIAARRDYFGKKIF